MFKLIFLAVLVTVLINSDTVEGFRRRRNQKQDNNPINHFIVIKKVCKSGACSGSGSSGSDSDDKTDRRSSHHSSHKSSRKGGCKGMPCFAYPPPPLIPPISQQTSQQPQQEEPTQLPPTISPVTTPLNNNGGNAGTTSSNVQTTTPNIARTSQSGVPATSPVATQPTESTTPPSCPPGLIQLGADVLGLNVPIALNLRNALGDINGVCVNVTALTDGQLLQLLGAGSLSDLINNLGGLPGTDGLPLNDLLPAVRDLLGGTGTNPLSGLTDTLTGDGNNPTDGGSNPLSGIGDTLGGLISGLGSG